MSSPLSPFDTVCAARMAVYKRLPYFMRMLFKLVPVERPEIGTFAVDDKLRIHYDPEAVVRWGVEKSATFLAHEVQHPLRRHHDRGAAFIAANLRIYTELQPILAQMHPALGFSIAAFWNCVADMEINPSVVEAGFEFPSDFTPFFPKQLQLADGNFAEEYARILFERAEKMRQQQQSKPGASSGRSDKQQEKEEEEEEASPGADPDDDDEDGDDEEKKEEPAPAPASAAPQPRLCEGCCGSVAGNANPVESSLDEEEAPVGSSPAETDIARRQVAHDTAEPTPEMKELMDRFGGGRGVHAGLAKWAANELAPPEVPWQRVLAPLVRDAVAYARGRSDWKIGRPSRRREVLKQRVGEEAPILPTLVGPIPNVGIVLDSSGSMRSRGLSGREVFEEALSEVFGVVAATGSPAWATSVDTQVQEWVRLRSKADAKKLASGGGGTDMRVGIVAAEEKKFDVIVLVTDGWTPWPTPREMPRHSRLVVCVVGNAEVPKHIHPVVRVKRTAGGRTAA